MKLSYSLVTMLSAALICQAADVRIPSIRVEVHGHGAPVILIPGLACSAEVWTETAAHLNAESFQTHSVTLPGFGGLQPIVTDKYLQTVGKDLVTYIKQQHLQHPVVIGHSLGGFLGLWIAAEYPDVAAKVISVDGLPFLAGIMNPTINAEAAKQMAEKIRQSMLSGTDDSYREQARKVVESMVTAPPNVERELKVDLSSDRATVAQAMAELIGTDLRPEIAKIKVPVLVLGSWANYKSFGATHDSATALYRTQFQNFPAAQITMSDTAKHFIQLDAPDWFYTQVDTFLKD